MNVAALLKRVHGSQTYTVTRSSADGAYSGSDGTFIEGAASTLQIRGSIQPMTYEDLISIPEGDRTTERFRFYSTPDLKNNDSVLLRKSDVITISGVDYRVEKVGHWPGYSKAIVVRVNTDVN